MGDTNIDVRVTNLGCKNGERKIFFKRKWAEAILKLD
eukprot:CAMPEP_0116054814 /NCGR_PEP_ID=MMETSP0322-20121206/3035_1 /TAXON_ID=163516 /ORGANISM="Leptocylindrus danicus var. apora, Strain B651" /LENGTH=36 /DNA_ID= /DNA_START= /DNA_END= /DNA_ORIENTATION=